MELAVAFIMSMSGLFMVDNHEFLETVDKQINQGAEWHYVGKSPLDPNSQSIQMCNDPCEEPYIMWKLKFPE
jgi:hypothetical protein|tara:strand:- start:160 stop:375 length:216 start_codon:yes stop_codon:yes gene_type:complete